MDVQPSIFLVGCATYHPRPLNPPQLENQYRSRSLGDPALRSFIERSADTPVSSWPPQVLELRTVTLIGYFYSPDLEIAPPHISLAQVLHTTIKSTNF